MSNFELKPGHKDELGDGDGIDRFIMPERFTPFDAMCSAIPPPSTRVELCFLKPHGAKRLYIKHVLQNEKTSAVRSRISSKLIFASCVGYTSIARNRTYIYMHTYVHMYDTGYIRGHVGKEAPSVEEPEGPRCWCALSPYLLKYTGTDILISTAVRVHFHTFGSTSV